MPPLLAAGIGAAGSLLSNAFNVGQQRRAGRKNRAFSREMFAAQEQAAIRQWNRQNQYNHPASQMQRLKSAGLNPHLVYGQSAAGAAGQAATPSTPSPQGATEQAGQIDFDLLQQVGKAAQIAIQGKTEENIEAQTDNTRQQTLNLTVDHLLKQAGLVGKELQNQLARELLPSQVEQAKQNIEATKAGIENTRTKTAYTIDKNEREILLNNKNLEKATQQILQSKAQTAQCY